MRSDSQIDNLLSFLSGLCSGYLSDGVKVYSDQYSDQVPD